MSAGNPSENLRTGTGTALAAPHGPSIADPVPVGIAGFAMTTFILSCVNAGFFGCTAATSMVLGLAVFYGGLAQLLAGMWALRRGETFYMTIAALKTNAAVLWVFITLTATYVLLALAELGIVTSSILPIGGTSGSPAASRPGPSHSPMSLTPLPAGNSSRPGRLAEVTTAMLLEDSESR